MTTPNAFPGPRSNWTAAGFGDRAGDLAAADIIVAVGDYTGGAAENMFTLADHGLVTGDIVHVAWQSVMGVALGGEGARYIVNYLSSSTFQLTSDGSTVVTNTADGTVVLIKGDAPTGVVTEMLIPRIIVAAGDATGGAAEDIFTPAQGTKGVFEGSALKILYKSAANVINGKAVDVTVYAKAPTVTYFQLAATVGGAVIDNAGDGTAVFVKTS